MVFSSFRLPDLHAKWNDVLAASKAAYVKNSGSSQDHTAIVIISSSSKAYTAGKVSHAEILDVSEI